MDGDRPGDGDGPRRPVRRRGRRRGAADGRRRRQRVRPSAWSATGLPTGLGIDPKSGVVSGIPSAGDAAAGPYVVTVTATDSGGSCASQTFIWNIADPITIKDPGDQSGTEGVPVSLPLQAADANGYALAWTATGLPPGLAINANTGLITGTPPAGAAASGPYVATVTARRWRFQREPVRRLERGQPGHGRRPRRSVRDPRRPGDAAGPGRRHEFLRRRLNYRAVGLPTGLGIDPASGLISGTVARSAAGPFTATVTVTDAQGYSGSQSIYWDVAGPVTVNDPGRSPPPRTPRCRCR